MSDDAQTRRVPIRIDPDIRRSRTLPAQVYGDPAWFALERERVFARSWQFAGDARRLDRPGCVDPATLLPGCLDEPILLARDEAGAVRALSNVCTHRGNLVAEEAGPARHLRCRYHGRRFGLDGKFQFMPGFEGVAGFPGPEDDLRPLAHGAWGPLHFVSLDPEIPFERFLAPVRERVGWMPFDDFAPDPAGDRDYAIAANWALYCDNFLEGFHIAYVHPALSRALDVRQYRTELFPGGTLQIGIATPGDPAFEPPAGHPDAGARVAALYYWLFPNLMLNFYPWGLSLNLVLPRGASETRVLYRTYVWRPELRERGAGADLDRVESEDQAIVQSVQHGVRSRLYSTGRYSPEHETGVHHFHRMLAARLDPDNA